MWLYNTPCSILIAFLVTVVVFTGLNMKYNFQNILIHDAKRNIRLVKKIARISLLEYFTFYFPFLLK